MYRVLLGVGSRGRTIPTSAWRGTRSWGSAFLRALAALPTASHSTSPPSCGSLARPERMRSLSNNQNRAELAINRVLSIEQQAILFDLNIHYLHDVGNLVRMNRNERQINTRFDCINESADSFSIFVTIWKTLRYLFSELPTGGTAVAFPSIVE